MQISVWDTLSHRLAPREGDKWYSSFLLFQSRHSWRLLVIFWGRGREYHSKCPRSGAYVCLDILHFSVTVHQKHHLAWHYCALVIVDHHLYATVLRDKRLCVRSIVTLSVFCVFVILLLLLYSDISCILVHFGYFVLFMFVCPGSPRNNSSLLNIDIEIALQAYLGMIRSGIFPEQTLSVCRV